MGLYFNNQKIEKIDTSVSNSFDFFSSSSSSDVIENIEFIEDSKNAIAFIEFDTSSRVLVSRGASTQSYYFQDKVKIFPSQSVYLSVAVSSASTSYPLKLSLSNSGTSITVSGLSSFESSSSKSIRLMGEYSYVDFEFNGNVFVSGSLIIEES